MIRFLVRSLGLWSLAGGFVAAVIDGMKSIAGATLRLTSCWETWTDLAGPTIAPARAWVEAKAGGAVWTALEHGLQVIPTALFFGGLGILLIALARRQIGRAHV